MADCFWEGGEAEAGVDHYSINYHCPLLFGLSPDGARIRATELPVSATA